MVRLVDELHDLVVKYFIECLKAYPDRLDHILDSSLRREAQTGRTYPPRPESIDY